MNYLVVVLLLLVVVWSTFRAFRVSSFLGHLRARATSPSGYETLPEATVVLCLRGADPLLHSCLEGLFQQDYPSYKVQIVVDHQDDPAWDYVTQFLERNPQKIQYNLSILRDKSTQRSLKCSSILQAINQLDSDCEIVAFIDADAIPESTWLRELVTPLGNPEIGVTSGYRWYLPTDSQHGSLVRHLWNYSATIMMQFLQIPWGGTFALRVETLHESGLISLWENALVEDAPISRSMALRGLRIEHIPSLFLVNRESCDLAGFLQWSQRQSLFVRLYHPKWPRLFALCAVNILLSLIGVVAFYLAVFSQKWMIAMSLVSIQVSETVSLFWMLILIRRNIHQTLEANGEIVGSSSFLYQTRFILAVPLCVVVCSLTTLLTQNLNRIKWREIVYEFEDAWSIRMAEYKPYKGKDDSVDSLASL